VDSLVYERNGSVISKANFIQKFSDFFIKTAYSAVDRKIECEGSDKDKFEMEILGFPFSIELSCSAALEKKLSSFFSAVSNARSILSKLFFINFDSTSL
jgi:hypothetical protein